jgi:hypothetical protein
MAVYYFDIETYSPGERPDPENDKIITVQFQSVDIRTGKPIGELTILKEWESSENAIVKELFDKFFKDGSNVWDFVPVGFNLNFEWEFLRSKFKKHLGKIMSSRELHYRIPHIDIKPIVVLLNNGNFAGAKLNRFAGKVGDGSVISTLYESGKYDEIEKYIRNENKAFLEFLQKIKLNISKLME